MTAAILGSLGGCFLRHVMQEGLTYRKLRIVNVDDRMGLERNQHHDTLTGVCTVPSALLGDV